MGPRGGIGTLTCFQEDYEASKVKRMPQHYLCIPSGSIVFTFSVPPCLCGESPSVVRMQDDSLEPRSLCDFRSVSP